MRDLLDLIGQATHDQLIALTTKDPPDTLGPDIAEGYRIAQDQLKDILETP